MFDPDKPIKSCEDDELSRCEFSKLLGDAILSYDDEESLVIGLLGEWGYGKTSIMNMALEHIKECYENDQNHPIIVEFNPWHFSNQNQLIKKFFDELSIKIDDENIKNGIKSYVNKLIPPMVGLASIIDPVRTQALIKNSEYFDDSQSAEESLESVKNSLNDLILEKNQKIIIIIDDIDRLSDLEIQQIFQLVKLLADFPNTIYMLSFDRKVVINALKKVQESSSEKYLEKIVQISFEVPKIDQSKIDDLLFKKIYSIINSSVDDFDPKIWWNIYYGGIQHFFNNIRDINRYINSLKFNFNIINDEVNVADFLAIMAIQVFEQSVYYDIRNNKDFFTGIFLFQVSGATTHPEEEIAKKYCDGIINQASKNNKDTIKGLLRYLFPKLESIYGKTNYGSDWLSGWRKELRICSPDIFETYFTLYIPKNTLSKHEIENVIDLADDLDSFKSSILEINKNGKIKAFLERFEDYTSDITEEHFEPIITSLIDIGDLLDEGYSGLMKPDTNMRILRIIHQILRRVDDSKIAFKILKNAIENAEHSIYTLVHEISVRDQEHGRYGLAEKPIPEEKRSVTSEQLDFLEDLSLQKIRKWAKKGDLIKNRNLDDILYMWKQWGDEKEVTDFINESIKDDIGLINFISGFTEKTSTWSSSDNFENIFTRINLKFMADFIDLDEIYPRIRSIKDSSNYNKLNDRHKLAIKLFLED